MSIPSLPILLVVFMELILKSVHRRLLIPRHQYSNTVTERCWSSKHVDDIPMQNQVLKHELGTCFMGRRVILKLTTIHGRLSASVKLHLLQVQKTMTERE